MNNPDYTPTFTTIAAILGATYVPACWHSEDEPLQDKGYIVFGDPADWRTLRIFVGKDWRDPKFTFQYGGLSRWNVGKVTKESAYYLSEVIEVSASMTRPPEAIAKDVKRRLVDVLAASHLLNVKRIEEVIKRDNEQAAWWQKMNLGDRGRGEVWRNGEARAHLDASSERFIKLEIHWLSRDQAEKLVQLLREVP